VIGDPINYSDPSGQIYCEEGPDGSCAHGGGDGGAGGGYDPGRYCPPSEESCGGFPGDPGPYPGPDPGPGGSGDSFVTTQSKDVNDAYNDLAKLNCYTLLGFATAKDAQSWFNNHMHFYDSHDGRLVVRGGVRGVPATGTPAPSRTDQAGDIYLNQDYNWGDFSKVTTSSGITYNYLGWFNGTYKSNLNSEQLGTFFIIRESMHNKPSDVAETVKTGQTIINDCLK
jgi:hypothetical protein